MVEFTIHGIIRGGKNNMGITRTGRHYPKKNWAEWRDRVVFELKEYLQSINFTEPLHGDLHFSVDYYAGDRRKRDVPAMEDSIFHCLEKAGVVEDDSQFKTCLWFNKGFSKENPAAMIKIEAIR